MNEELNICEMSELEHETAFKEYAYQHFSEPTLIKCMHATDDL